jgi:hypothetical protein
VSVNTEEVPIAWPAAALLWCVYTRRRTKCVRHGGSGSTLWGRITGLTIDAILRRPPLSEFPLDAG